MRIDGDQHALVGIGTVLAPDVGPSQKEALLGGEAIDGSGFFAGERVEHRHVGDTHAAVICRVFAQGELAVQLSGHLPRRNCRIDL